MSTLWTVNGVDLSSIFEAIRGSTSGTSINISNLGTSLSNIFLSKDLTKLPTTSSIVTNIEYQHNDLNTIFQPLGSAPGITLRQTISSGSGTWYTSTFSAIIGYAIKHVFAIVVGGGGAGGGSSQILNKQGVGGGGGGTEIGFVDVASGSVSYTIGAGGIGVSNGNGNAGSDSIFGTITALGGEGGAGGVPYPIGAASCAKADGGSTPYGDGGYYSAGAIVYSIDGKVINKTLFNGILSPIVGHSNQYSQKEGGASYGSGGHYTPSVTATLGGGGYGLSPGDIGGANPGGSGAIGVIYLYY